MTSASVFTRCTAWLTSSVPSKNFVTSSMPSMNTKARTRENWLLMAYTNWSVKRAQAGDAFLVLVVLEAFLERRELAAGFLTAGLHQPFEHAVEVEVPKRAVQVIGPADGPARFHPRKTGHGLAGEGPHGRLVGVQQG